MIWFTIILTSLICVFPLIINIFFPSKQKKHSHNIIYLDDYKNQIAQLTLDYQQGLINSFTFEQSKDDIYQQILNVNHFKKDNTKIYFPPYQKLFMIFLLLPIPICALTLYCINGQPWLPAQSLNARLKEQQLLSDQIAPYILQLRIQLDGLDFNDPNRFKGYVLLGQVQANQGHIQDAIKAWKRALSQHFDPNLAVKLAELIYQYEHHVSQESADLFRQALSTGNQNALWRSLAQERLAEYNKQ